MNGETPGPPIVVTVAPTPTPGPVPLHEVGYVSLPRDLIGGFKDAIFVPTPTPQPPAPELPVLPVSTPAPYYPASSTEFDFLAGWHDGGGAVYKGDAAVHRWVQCESTWRVVTPGFYLGLVQFAPSTWGSVAAITGYWEWVDPYQHGFNAATWAHVSDPHTQWPTCWTR